MSMSTENSGNVVQAFPRKGDPLAEALEGKPFDEGNIAYPDTGDANLRVREGESQPDAHKRIEKSAAADFEVANGYSDEGIARHIRRLNDKCEHLGVETKRARARVKKTRQDERWVLPRQAMGWGTLEISNVALSALAAILGIAVGFNAAATFLLSSGHFPNFFENLWENYVFSPWR